MARTDNEQAGASYHGQAAGLISAVRQATERFKDVKVAEAEGYSLMFGCVSGPDYGAMGLHYVNLPLCTRRRARSREAGDHHLRTVAERAAENDRRGFPGLCRRLAREAMLRHPHYRVS